MHTLFVVVTNCVTSLRNYLTNWRSRVVLQQRIRACPIDRTTKVVVYTAIFGGRDTLQEVPSFPGIEYICFTDDEKLTSKTWTIKRTPAPYADPIKSAKIFKILPHRFFPHHEYSLWVDGTHIPTIDIRYLIYKFLDKNSLALFKHLKRNCIYEEMATCIDYNKDDATIITKQKEKYRRENYPEQNGLVAGNIILRRHHVPLVKATMEDWWEEIDTQSIRDQLSFNYVAHRHHMPYTIIPGNVYNNHFFKFTEHQRPSCTQLSVGWILNSTPETASARIMGYNVHDYLLSQNIFSKILYRPTHRHHNDAPLTLEAINNLLNNNINVLVIVKSAFRGIDYLIRRCRKKGIKLVYAVCDLPVKTLVKEADAILAPSREYYTIIPKKYHPKLNIVFDGYEQPPAIAKDHTTLRQIKLCFVTNQVWDEFPGLKQLPQDVRLKIIGPDQDILTTSFKNSQVFKKSPFDFEYIYWNLKTVYPEILECDVGIIPWPRIGKFQKIKSINRLVMFMALGLPVIASPVPAYLEIIRHQENGFIAPTAAEWTKYVSFLRDHPQKRREIGARARADVLQKYSKENQAALYCEIFNKILASPATVARLANH